MMSAIPQALLALGRIRSEQADVTLVMRENLVTPLHAHDTHNHVLVCRGVLYLTLEGEERALSAGQWASIPAGALHAERFVEPTELMVFWLVATD